MRPFFILLCFLAFCSACGSGEVESEAPGPTELNEDHDWSEKQVLRFLVLCRLNAEEDGLEQADEHCRCFFNYISGAYPEGIVFDSITVGDLRDGRAACFDY
jgi:hypothetical protein